MSLRSPHRLTVLRPLGRPAPPLVRWLARPCTKCLCCFSLSFNTTRRRTRLPLPGPRLSSASHCQPSWMVGTWTFLEVRFQSSFSSVGPLQGHESNVSCVELAGLLNVDESFPEVAQMLHQVSKRPRRGRQGNDVPKLDVPATSQGRSTGESKATQKVHVHDSFQVQVFVELLQGGFGCMQGGHCVGSFGGSCRAFTTRLCYLW